MCSSDLDFLIDPLARPLISERDAGVNEFTYVKPFNTSLDLVDLSLLGSNTGGAAASPANVANLTPDQLSSLQPAAGGNGQQGASAASSDEDANCANAFLDSEWDKAPANRDCNVGGKKTVQ